MARSRLSKELLRECHKKQGTWERFVEIREGYRATGKASDECWLLANEALPVSEEVRTAVIRERYGHLNDKQREWLGKERVKGSAERTGVELLDWVYSQLDTGRGVDGKHAGDKGLLEYYRENRGEFYRVYMQAFLKRLGMAPKEEGKELPDAADLATEALLKQSGGG